MLVGHLPKLGCDGERRPRHPVWAPSLNDHPEVLTFHRLAFTTPSLAGRLIQYTLGNEETLAAALGGDITARLQAAQVIAVQRVLARASLSLPPSM
jgi:hypothetical protein